MRVTYYLLIAGLSGLIACQPAASLDAVAPTVNLRVSASAVTAPGEATLEVWADDTSGVAAVELLEAGNVLQTWSAPPYVYAAAFKSAGTYRYSARARDNRGNIAQSVAVSVTVVP